MTTTKTSTGPKAQSWGRHSDDVDRHIAARTTPESIEAAYQAYLAGSTQTKATSPVAPIVKAVNGASDKQSALIDKLLTERVHSYAEADVVAAKADWRLTRKMIDFLLDPTTPRRVAQAPTVVVETPAAPARARLNFSEIADGNYALRVDGVVKFYRVSTSKSSGYKKVQVRASDALYTKDGNVGIAILHRIVETGLVESQMLFAQELGRCWMCGKTLTDETSRARGTGPDCASR